MTTFKVNQYILLALFMFVTAYILLFILMSNKPVTANQCVISQDCNFAAFLKHQTIDVFQIVKDDQLVLQYTVQLLPPSDEEGEISATPRSFTISSGRCDFVAVSWLGICHVYQRGAYHSRVHYDGQCYFLPNNLLALVRPKTLRLYRIKKAHTSHTQTMDLPCHTIWACFHREFALTTQGNELVQLWSIEDGHLIVSFKCINIAQGALAAVSPRTHLLALYQNNRISIYDIESGLQVNEWVTYRPILAIGFVDDAYLTLVSSARHLPHQAYVELWDTTVGSCMASREEQFSTDSRSETTTISAIGFRCNKWVFAFTNERVKLASASLSPIPLIDRPALVLPPLERDSQESLFYEFHDSHATSPGVATYFLDKHRVLRVGTYSAQLWIATGTSRAARSGYVLHKLLYIFSIPETSAAKGNAKAGEKSGDCTAQPASINAKCIRWRGNNPDIQFFDNDWVSITMSDGSQYTICFSGNLWSKFQCVCVAISVVYQVDVYSKIKGWKSRTFDHTLRHMTHTVEHSINHQPKFFESPAGNLALAGLVQYPKSSKLLKKVLNGSIGVKPVSIVSPFPCHLTSTTSILEIAVGCGAYEYARILVTYMIQSSKQYHPGYLVTFTRALPILSSKCPDFLLDWMHQLSYMPVTQYCPIVEGVSSTFESAGGWNVSTRLPELCGFTTVEHLPAAASDVPSVQAALRQRGDQHEKPHLATLCVFPLLHYNQYRNQYATYGDDCSSSSLFARQASSGNSEVFHEGEPVMEALLMYKWRTFARARFFLVFLAYVANQVLFSVNVAFPKINNTFTLVLMLVVSALLITQETRHIWYNGRGYFRLFYNYISLAAVLLPVAGAIVILSGREYPVEASAISVFVLWLHTLVRLRVLRDLGLVFEIVVQISRRMLSLAFLLLIVLCTFTHTFIVLLYSVSDREFVPSYVGTVDTVMPLEMTNNPDSANRFRDVGVAVKTVWFFLHGRWDVLQGRPVESRPLVNILSVIFSLSTNIILFNVLIALMTSIVAEVKRKGKRVWIAYLAESLAEIELFWCFPWERQNQKYHPTYIYYVAHVKTIQKYDNEQTQYLLNES
ncbi:hypothetical protein BJV82DRAFT_593684 [Fennellomyces sp. T-0311]|nr:hypothetical protein BJV82DRAFT_593684 [Fennellomyces sp. T-0311]